MWCMETKIQRPGHCRGKEVEESTKMLMEAIISVCVSFFSNPPPFPLPLKSPAALSFPRKESLEEAGGGLFCLFCVLFFRLTENKHQTKTTYKSPPVWWLLRTRSKKVDPSLNTNGRGLGEGKYINKNTPLKARGV